jgi:hypothetical protein
MLTRVVVMANLLLVSLAVKIRPDAIIHIRSVIDVISAGLWISAFTILRL